MIGSPRYLGSAFNGRHRDLWPETGRIATGLRMANPVPQPMRVGVRRWQVTLPGSPIALQHLILRDFADPLGLLVPHLDDDDLVTVGDADRNFVAPGLQLPLTP